MPPCLIRSWLASREELPSAVRFETRVASNRGTNASYRAMHTQLLQKVRRRQRRAWPPGSTWRLGHSAPPDDRPCQPSKEDLKSYGSSSGSMRRLNVWDLLT